MTVSLILKCKVGPINSWATIDTRIEAFDTSYQFTIKKAPFAINMVSLDNKTFINALRSKLMWGQDQRN
jgi:NAD+ kinase